MPARRTWFVWHSWIGLTAGLLLFVVCWSGAVAVFARDLDWLLDGRLHAAAAEPIAWQAMYESIREARPEWTIGQIQAPYAPGYAAEAWMFDENDVMRRIYLDPATGEIVAATSYLNIQRFFRSLHMALFIYDLPILGVPFGFFFVGLLALVLAASLVTSLVFYRRFWRGFFKLQTNRGAKVFWSDLHKLTGLWSLWFTILIAVTGFWYLAEWWTPEGPAGPEPPVELVGSPLPMDALVSAARAAYPQLEVRTIVTDQIGEGLFAVHGQDGALLVRDRAAKAWVNSYTGEVLAVQRPSELTLYQYWIDMADPLHFGDFAALWSKAIWFLFGLAVSGLCLTGAYLQARRQRLRDVGRHRGPIMLAYAATLGILGWAAFGAWEELLGYGPDGSWMTLTSGQAAFLIAWVASTLAILTVWMWKLR